MVILKLNVEVFPDGGLTQFFANSMSPQKTFVAPIRPKTPIRNLSENSNSVEVKMLIKERRASKAPTTIIKRDKGLSIFSANLKTSHASTPVVSLRSASFLDPN